MTGAGGEGGPRGIFLLILNFGGSIGSLCTSTMRMTLCLAPELNETPCCEGVYRMYCAAEGRSAHLTGMAAEILDWVIFSRASLVLSVFYGGQRVKKNNFLEPACYLSINIWHARRKKSHSHPWLPLPLASAKCYHLRLLFPLVTNQWTLNKLSKTI